MKSVIVWDLPTRFFHWTLVVSFVGLFITGDSERWRDLHVLLGYTVAGLLIFRIGWGFFGSRYARFSDFVRGPGAIMAYLKSLGTREPERHTGHNPAGAVAILLLIGLGLISSLTGWLLFEDLAEEWMEELHEAAANAMLVVVALHVFAVLASSWIHRENLVKAMLTGRKQGADEGGIPRSYPIVGALLVSAVVSLWAWAALAPGDLSLLDRSNATERVETQDNDDDE